MGLVFLKRYRTALNNGRVEYIYIYLLLCIYIFSFNILYYLYIYEMCFTLFQCEDVYVFNRFYRVFFSQAHRYWEEEGPPTQQFLARLCAFALLVQPIHELVPMGSMGLVYSPTFG